MYVCRSLCAQCVCIWVWILHAYVRVRVCSLFLCPCLLKRPTCMKKTATGFTNRNLKHTTYLVEFCAPFLCLAHQEVPHSATIMHQWQLPVCLFVCPHVYLQEQKWIVEYTQKINTLINIVFSWELSLWIIILVPILAAIAPEFAFWDQHSSISSYLLNPKDTQWWRASYLSKHFKPMAKAHWNIQTIEAFFRIDQAV